MNAEKVRSAFLQGAATIALPTMAVCTHMVARNVAIMPSNPFSGAASTVSGRNSLSYWMRCNCQLPCSSRNLNVPERMSLPDAYEILTAASIFYGLFLCVAFYGCKLYQIRHEKYCAK